MNLAWILLLFMSESMVNSDKAELYLYQTNLQVELRNNLIIPLSWKQKSSSTLTLTQDVSGAPTDVLKVNGTDYDILNNWRPKATVEFWNETTETGDEISWLNVTLTNVALEDEGVYKIKLRAEGEQDLDTLFNTGYFKIVTYALPIYINIAVNHTAVVEGTEKTFTCSGNVGRQSGNLQLLRSSVGDHSYFMSVATVKILDLPDSSRAMLVNGTYTVNYMFRRTMSRSDNGTVFKCRVTHEIPKRSVRDSVQTQTLRVTYNNQAMSYPSSGTHTFGSGRQINEPPQLVNSMVVAERAMRMLDWC